MRSPQRPDPTVATSNVEAARAADVVVLAIPFASAPEVAAEIAEAVAGKPVVDVSNRISFGPNGPEIDTTSSNGEAIGALLPAAGVVKAFNTLFATHQTDPIADGVQLDGFVAGDDPAAKATVLELVDSIARKIAAPPLPGTAVPASCVAAVIGTPGY